jgi:iron(III) transport system permease protein
MKIQRTRGSLVPLGLAFVAALVSLVPLWYLFVQSLSQGFQPFVDELLQERTLSLIIRSSILAGSVTVASVVIGTFAAWVVTMSGLPGRTLLTVAFSLPLAIPSYLSAFAWISWQPGLSGFAGAFIVLTFACFPYVMLPVAAAMSRLNPVHEEIARAMGRTQTAIVREVIIPQLRRPIAAGALLVALYTLSDFGAVAAMRHEVFTWVIYGAYRAGFNPTGAATLSMVLLAAALALTFAESFVRGRNDPSKAGAAARRQDPGLRRSWIFIASIGTLTILAPSVGVPITTIIEWLGRETTRAVSWSNVWEATGQSFVNGLATAVVTLLFALPVAWCAVRMRGTLASLPERATYLTHALPGIVVAISVVYVGIRAVRPWYQEFPLLIFGQVVIFLPVMVASIRASLEKTPVMLEDVAHSLGSNATITLVRVTLPLALPGLLAGTALTMLAAVKELPVTLLLRPTGMDTLSTKIWNFSTLSDYAAVGPYAVAMLILAAVPTALLGTLSAVKGQRS